MDRRFPVRPDGGFRHDDLEWLHGLYTLLIVVALLVGAILLLRLLLQRPRPPRDWPRHPAIDELDLRYARGELERADYLQRRADLLDHAIAAPPTASPGAPPSPLSPSTPSKPPPRTPPPPSARSGPPAGPR